MLKLVVVIVLVAHGLGHTMALSSAFRPAGGFSRRHWTLSDGDRCPQRGLAEPSPLPVSGVFRLPRRRTAVFREHRSWFGGSYGPVDGTDEVPE
jgi:hypothetical protein